MSISNSDSPLGGELEPVQEGSIILASCLGLYTVPATSQATAGLGQVLFGCSRQGEGGARSAETPEPVLLREHLPGCSFIHAAEQVPCDAHGRGGLPPTAAGEITLYTITTIYLWYVLIYNIHCVR